MLSQSHLPACSPFSFSQRSAYQLCSFQSTSEPLLHRQSKIPRFTDSRFPHSTYIFIYSITHMRRHAQKEVEDYTPNKIKIEYTRLTNKVYIYVYWRGAVRVVHSSHIQTLYNQRAGQRDCATRPEIINFASRYRGRDRRFCGNSIRIGIGDWIYDGWCLLE